MKIPSMENTGDAANAVHRRPASLCAWGNFRLSFISVIVGMLFLTLGIVLQYSFAPGVDLQMTAYIAGGSLIGLALLFILPWWHVVLLFIAGLWFGPGIKGIALPWLSGCMSLGFLFAPGFAVVSQWNKIVVLRLGRFYRVRGPGPIFLFPFFDTVAGTIDTRIRVTDFSAEKSLTMDTVPVHIDALAFWMIWDAQKAVMEVQHYAEAVVLSAQTALRSTIGSNSLTALLSERERLGSEIQKIVDKKTNPWGITIISVEFKEILVPKELEDALSREAQAEREKKARIILGTAEAEISTIYSHAAEQYKDDSAALQLRAMNMIYESMRNKGGLILTPASALESMNLGSVLGSAAYAEKSSTLPAGSFAGLNAVMNDSNKINPGDGAKEQ